VWRRLYGHPATGRSGCPLQRGYRDGMIARVYEATGEALLVPTRNRLEQGRPYNRPPGNGPKDERVAEGIVVPKKAGNAAGGKGPY